jgi:hypothetical protein
VSNEARYVRPGRTNSPKLSARDGHGDRQVSAQRKHKVGGMFVMHEHRCPHSRGRVAENVGQAETLVTSN